MKLLYRDFPDLWAELKRLNDGVIRNNKEERQGVLYEFKQMKSTDNTLAQWEERFKKEIGFEKRVCSNDCTKENQAKNAEVSEVDLWVLVFFMACEDAGLRG